jgi:hypothetical protein
MKKLQISMSDARKETWRMMLITSQSNTPPKIGKNTKTETIQGVQVAMFRISDENMNALFGSAVLPALNPKDMLAQKLMRQAHTIRKYDFHPIHRTIESSRTALSSGTWVGTRVRTRSYTISTDGHIHLCSMQCVQELVV